MRKPGPIISSGSDDATIAYLFTSGADPLVHAISRERDGCNLPLDVAPAGWVLEQSFALGVREAIPARIAPEPVLRGLQANGYFVWREGSNPKGTSQ